MVGVQFGGWLTFLAANRGRMSCSSSGCHVSQHFATYLRHSAHTWCLFCRPVVLACRCAPRNSSPSLPCLLLPGEEEAHFPPSAWLCCAPCIKESQQARNPLGRTVVMAERSCKVMRLRATHNCRARRIPNRMLFTNRVHDSATGKAEQGRVLGERSLANTRASAARARLECSSALVSDDAHRNALCPFPWRSPPTEGCPPKQPHACTWGVSHLPLAAQSVDVCSRPRGHRACNDRVAMLIQRRLHTSHTHPRTRHFPSKVKRWRISAPAPVARGARKTTGGSKLHAGRRAARGINHRGG
eukprot:364899-Chlamydomonas_euryale.AAC.7